MHTVIVADGALEAKNAQVAGHNQNFEGGTVRKNERTERTKGRQERAKVINVALMNAVWGVKKVKNNDWKCLKSFCKFVFLISAGSTTLKTCDSKNAFEH